MAPSCLSLVLCVLLLVHGAARRAEATLYSHMCSENDAVFQYSKYHTVSEVDAAGYRNCITANAVLTSSDGNTTVPLTAPGDRYQDALAGGSPECGELGFVAKPETTADAAVNLMIWHCTIPGKHGDHKGYNFLYGPRVAYAVVQDKYTYYR
uniref:Phytocyanin domain-containing protein n=1 Tax=Oryza brachyantha TaxID=4533 RepID=J3NA50_ORYBR